MSTRFWAALVAVVAACSGGAGDGDDVNDPIDAAALDAPVDGRPVDARVDAPTIDAPPGSNGGFVLPTAVTKANTFAAGTWTEAGDADWTCLGTPSTGQPSTGNISLTGRILDFQTGNGVGNASISAWSTSPAMSVGTATSSNVTATRGDFSMTLGMLPAGTRRYGFSIAAANYTSTVVLGRYYAPGAAATDDIDLISEATALALPAFIGLTRDETKALYIGSMRDCQGRAVSNAVAGVSFVPTTFSNGGGQTFYFSAGSTSLPVRHTVAPVMNKDGLFIVLDVPPGAGLVVQVWGFRTTAELSSGVMTLLGEIAAPSQTGESVSVSLDPRRS